MNKHKQQMKQLVTTGAIAAGILAVLGGVFYWTDSASDDAIAKKSAAEADYTAAQKSITDLKTQLQQSNDAEKGFAALQLVRSNLDFTANNDTMRDVLRAAKTQYRFSNNFKLTVSPEVASDKASQISSDYTITLRPQMKIEFDAMSDVHVFSFMDELTRQAPGLIRFEGMKLTRKGDMDNAALNDMRRGGTPYLVEAVINFSWIGVAPAASKTSDQPLSTGRK